MEKQRFEILLDGIRVGNYPPSLGYTITVDQFLRIQAVCGNLITQVPPGDNKGLPLIIQYLTHWKTKVDDIVELEKRLAESLKAKIGLFDAIHKVIDAYQSDDTKDCILLVHGDKVNQKARFQIYGDVQSMAMTFAALLDNENSDFKRFIFSLLGVYLSKNPEDHKMFENGIELAKQSFGVN
jgi:hypothetical protein